MAALQLAVTAPATAASDELTFHQAVADYAGGRFDAAERAFQRVLRNRPDDAASIQYLGLIARAQERPDEALELFRRAAELAPEDPGPLTRIAESLLEVQLDREALDAADRGLTLAPQDPELNLYAGIARFRLRQFRGALIHLEEAAKEPTLARDARYYAGLSEVFRGEVYAATAAFEEVAALSPAHPLGRSANALRERIQPRLPDRDWAVSAMVGAEIDSNTTVNSNLADQVLDGRGVFRLAARARPYKTRDLALGLGYTGFLGIQGSASEVNDQTHQVSGSARYDAGFSQLSLTYDFAVTLLDLTDPYRLRHRVEPSASFRTGELGLLRAFYGFEFLDFQDDPPNAFDRSGMRHSAGLTQIFYLPTRVLSHAEVGGAFVFYDSDGSEYRSIGGDLTAELVGKLPLWDMGAQLGYRFAIRDHLEGSKFATSPTEELLRLDTQHRVELGVTLPIGQRLTLGASAAAVFVDSTEVDEFDYDRFVGGLYATYEF